MKNYKDDDGFGTSQQRFENDCDEGMNTTAKPLSINSQTNGEEGIPVRQPNEGDYFIGSRFIYKSHTDGGDREAEPDTPEGFMMLIGGRR